MAHSNALPTWILTFVSAAILTASTAVANPETWKRQGWSKTDFSKSSVTFSEILSGGPPKDGIPSIDKPVFQTVAEATELVATEPVIGLEVNGDARAYPLRILTWHEIVNDAVGGKPVAVTYCPLCNAAIVFDRTLDGRVLDFGTTGKLRHSDLVMYDRQTESWWQQFTGEAIIGELLGKTLALVPARLESFADFKARHPEGKVLKPNNPKMRSYGRNPYLRYDSASQPFLFSGDLPKGIPPMTRVVVVRLKDGPIAVSLPLLVDKKAITIDGIALTWKPGQNSALDTRDISKGKDVGTVSVTRRSASGATELVAYDVTFAFVFHAFHPERPLHKSASTLN
ncbi:MAG: DUF3179 domain-containing protein [Pseudomonadota bacterium]